MYAFISPNCCFIEIEHLVSGLIFYYSNQVEDPNWQWWSCVHKTDTSHMAVLYLCCWVCQVYLIYPSPTLDKRFLILSLRPAWGISGSSPEVASCGIGMGARNPDLLLIYKPAFWPSGLSWALENCFSLETQQSLLRFVTNPIESYK